MWQHVQGVVEFLLTSYSKFTAESSSEKKFQNRFRFDKIVAMSLRRHFFWPTLYVILLLSPPLLLVVAGETCAALSDVHERPLNVLDAAGVMVTVDVRQTAQTTANQHFRAVD